MATKDWTEKKLEKDHFVFTNRNGRKIYVAKQTAIPNGRWYVEFAWMYHEYKLFDTQSQALAFAKRYMRSH